jgi:hypothetical protein
VMMPNAFRSVGNSRACFLPFHAKEAVELVMIVRLFLFGEHDGRNSSRRTVLKQN